MAISDNRPIEPRPRLVTNLSTHPKYRPDIDGLRAVAVLSVVIFHAFPSLMTGGFIGVDVFFVISGFLISTIIIDNLEKDSFSFAQFYARRVRRIFPALVLVLVATILFSWFALRSDEYKQVGKHIFAGSAFVSNLILWSESGYFDSIANTKPLLHLWSLGVEEQFYIVWPLLLWLARKCRLNLLIVICGIACISFIANVITVMHDPTAAFYAPHTRFWELMVGAILAYLTIRKEGGNQGVGVIGGVWKSVLGVGFLIAGEVFITKDRMFPGWWALLPTVGTSLVIAAGPGAWINRALLSHPLMVWVGLISYPLYLWHWPLFSFAYVLAGDVPSHGVRAVLVLVSILLAWVTHRLIERPISVRSNLRLKTVALIASMSVVGIVGLYIFERNGFEDRFRSGEKRYHSAPVDPPEAENSAKLAKQIGVFSHTSPVSGRDFVAIEGGAVSQADIAVIGDSHAHRLYTGLADFSKRSLLNIGRGTCPPFFDVDIYDKTGTSLECQPMVNNYLTFVKGDPHIKIIIISAFFSQYGRDVVMRRNGRKIDLSQAFSGTLDFLSDASKTVVVALDVPEIPAMCYRRKFPVWRSDPEAVRECTIDARRYLGENEVVRTALAGRAVRIFEPAELFCDGGRCGETDGRDYLYMADGNHLNELGVRRIGKALATYLHQAD